MLRSVDTMVGKMTPSQPGQVGKMTPSQPDQDTIKMFVGQIPKSMDENDLTAMFQVFGPIHELNVLRDKVTGLSRGCCFVTYFTRKHALEAQNALHNVKTLEGMNHPIQMKPADTENRNERKLFVGMVSKRLNEEGIKKMFAVFGPIEDCTVLRDEHGISKGCGFVTFTSRNVAAAAIKAMHHSQTMDGCSSPLVVKFADTQKEKENKKLQELQTSLWSLEGSGSAQLQPALLRLMGTGSPADNLIGSPLTLGYSQLPQLITPQTNGQLPPLTSQLSHQLTSQLSQQLSQQLLPQAHLSPLYQDPVTGQLVALSDTNTQSSILNGHSNGGVVGQLASPYGLPGLYQGLYPASSLLQGQVHQQLALQAPLRGIQGATTQLSNIPAYQDSFPVSTATLSLTSTQPPLITSLPYSTGDLESKLRALDPAVIKGSAAAGGGGGELKPKEGKPPHHEPAEGTNLFIYHLPQEYTDADLHETFQPFGTIVSAKVFMDKQTNLSKCFGFVSFTNADSAQCAIQAMNGFQVGTKRLKVQLKKSRDKAKPY